MKNRIIKFRAAVSLYSEVLFFGGMESHMTLWEAVLCGILQGLTEFLPVSSSGHLALAHAFFGMENAESYLSFDILLHLATLIVVFTVYRKDIFALIPAFFTLTGKIFRGNFRFSSYNEMERMVLLLILATLPLVAAFFVKDTLEAIAGYTRIVGVILFLNGILLLCADRFAGKEKKAQLSPRGALGVGIFQLFAVIPGLSRSGSTISGGMLFGLSRKNAVRFSFLMSVPAILGANIMNIPEAFSARIEAQTLGYYLIGMVAAAVSGFFAMRLLAYISAKEKFGFFAYYCMIIGVLAVVFG